MAAPALVSASVQILDISCVKPLHATKRFNLYLPYADACFEGIGYVGDVLFYSLDSADACNIKALKNGLSLALVPFYPVAGRLHRDSTTAQLTIDCNDDGVKFVEAVTDCDFAALEEKSFPIHEFYAELATFSHLTEDPALLSIQVTRFQGGRGIAVGVAASHVVFDAHSLWYFLKSWDQCCRGQGVSLPPLHVRALMSSKFWSMDKLASKESFIRDSTPRSLPRRLTTKSYHYKVMHFDSSTAQQLKRTAVEESGNVHISTFQAVMACVWKRFTAAHDLPPHHKMCLIVSGDLRHKLMPSLTDAYFGNAVLSTCVRATTGDLKKESVGRIAAKINESLKVFADQMYLRERLASRETEFSDIANIKGKVVDQHYLIVSHGPRLPVYDVDVGMGKPLAVRPASITPDFVVCFYPGRQQGSIDVSLCFSSLQTLQAFLSITSPCLDI